MGKWFEKSGTQSDIVVSSRIRLARNLSGLPFPARLTAEQAVQILDRAEAAVNATAAGARCSRIDFHKLDELHRGVYAEKHLASRELCEGRLPRGLLLSDDEAVSIMVNEEDHLRIQVIGAGLCIDQCLEEAERLNTVLDEQLHFAFHESYGYLTACPTNLGCGLRASVMLHLPAMTENGDMQEIIASAGKIGLTIRGMYGEGTAAQAALYQVSNALSLGYTERELTERLNKAVLQIINRERTLRKRLLKDSRIWLEDRICRAGATLSAARLIGSEEAMKLLSSLRMGAGVLDGETGDTAIIDRLLWEIQPCSVTLHGENIDSPMRRDAERADIIRRALTK